MTQTAADLQQIARFIRSHEPPMVRVTGDRVEFAVDCVQVSACDGQPDVGAAWCEIASVRSMGEARTVLGY